MERSHGVWCNQMSLTGLDLKDKGTSPALRA